MARRFAINEERIAEVVGDANAALVRAVTLEGMQPETRRVGAARMRCFLQSEQGAPDRGPRPAGSRTKSSRPCSADSPLCLLLTIHCSAPLYRPQSPAVPLRWAATLRSGNECTPRRGAAVACVVGAAGGNVLTRTTAACARLHALICYLMLPIVPPGSRAALRGLSPQVRGGRCPKRRSG